MTDSAASIPTSLSPRWNDQGLIPAIAQDAVSGEVLMLAWMNAEALAQSLASGQATYWSRSRQALWRKGETSGNTQDIVDIRLDCDGDTRFSRGEDAIETQWVALETTRASPPRSLKLRIHTRLTPRVFISSGGTAPNDATHNS